MAYIPSGAKWYVAEIVEEITVEGDPRNVVHKNLTLINADSPEQAYDRAIELGRQCETSYSNPGGKTVHVNFRGLGYLDVIHDQLEHGAELLFEERTSVSEDDIERWIVAKEQLTVFQKADSTPCRPDYSAQDVVEEAEKSS